MIFNREWAMPNAFTFSIPPIYQLINRYLRDGKSCGWNSNGFGKGLGFEMIELLLIAHGSMHNDTIVTIERKFTNDLFQ
jgi:hypothetical protein